MPSMKIKHLLKKRQQNRRSLLDISTGEEEILQATRQMLVDPFERFVSEGRFSDEQKKTGPKQEKSSSNTCGFERRDDSATLGGIGVVFEKFGDSIGENITNFSCSSSEQTQCMAFSKSKCKDNKDVKKRVSSLAVSTSDLMKEGRSTTSTISPTSIIDVHNINAHSSAEKIKSSNDFKPSPNVKSEDERREELSKLASLKALVEKEKSRIDLQLREGSRTDRESRSEVVVDDDDKGAANHAVDKFVQQDMIGSDCDTLTRKNGINAPNRYSYSNDSALAARKSNEKKSIFSEPQVVVQSENEDKPHLSPQIKSSSIPISCDESSVNLSCASSVNVEETKKVLFPTTVDDAATDSFHSIPMPDRARVKISVTSNMKNEGPKTGLQSDAPLLQKLRPEELLGSLYSPIFSFLEKYFENGCAAKSNGHHSMILVSPERKDQTKEQGVEVTLGDFSAKDTEKPFATDGTSKKKKKRGKKKERKYEPLKLNLSVVLEESRLVSDESEDTIMDEDILSPPRVNRNIQDLPHKQPPMVVKKQDKKPLSSSSKNVGVRGIDIRTSETEHAALNNSWTGAENRFKTTSKPASPEETNWIGALIKSPEKKKQEATHVTIELRVKENEDTHGDTELNVSIESISSDGPWLDGKEEAFHFANDPVLQLSIDSNSTCEEKDDPCLNVSISGIFQMNSNQSNALLDQMQQEEEKSTGEIYTLNAEETNALLDAIATEANTSHTEQLGENGDLDSSGVVCACLDAVVERVEGSADVSIYSSGSEVEIIQSPSKSVTSLESFPEVDAISFERSRDEMVVREESFCDEAFPTSSACRGEERDEHRNAPISYEQDKQVMEQRHSLLKMKSVSSADGRRVTSVRSIAMAFETFTRPNATKAELHGKDTSDRTIDFKNVDETRNERHDKCDSEENRICKEGPVVKGGHKPSDLRVASEIDDCAGSVRSIAKAFEISSKSKIVNEKETGMETCNQSVATNTVYSYLYDKGGDDISCCSSLTMSTAAPPSSVTSFSKAPNTVSSHGLLPYGRIRASNGIAARIAAFERASASDASV